MNKIIFLLLFPAIVWASPEDTQRLKDVVQQIKQSCTAASCEAPFSQETLYSRSSRVRSPKYTSETHENFRQAASDQAQIWGDTILEGDYYAAGHTRVDAVVAVYKDETLIAYHYLYSEKSWDTSTCEFSGRRDTLKDCTAGRIAESSYASPDLKTNLTDEDDYADFEEGAQKGPGSFSEE